MKTLSLSGVLVAASCTFQACHSPENRSPKTDSSKVGGSATDTSKSKMNATGNGSKEGKAPNLINETKVDDMTANFMKVAALGGMMEVDLGKIALKSANPKLRRLGSK